MRKNVRHRGGEFRSADDQQGLADCEFTSEPPQFCLGVDDVLTGREAEALQQQN
jgi:hypothetical protein